MIGTRVVTRIGSIVGHPRNVAVIVGEVVVFNADAPTPWALVRVDEVREGEAVQPGQFAHVDWHRLAVYGSPAGGAVLRGEDL